MEVMCMIAVLVNCALIGLSGQVHRMFPEMSTTQTILLIVALEVRYATFTSLDDTTSWKTEYKFVWSMRMTQDTKGGRTVYIKILPTMHFISLHLAVPILCPNSHVHMSLFYWSSDYVFLAAYNVVTAVHDNMCNPWPS